MMVNNMPELDYYTIILLIIILIGAISYGYISNLGYKIYNYCVYEKFFVKFEKCKNCACFIKESCVLLNE